MSDLRSLNTAHSATLAERSPGRLSQRSRRHARTGQRGGARDGALHQRERVGPRRGQQRGRPAVAAHGLVAALDAQHDAVALAVGAPGHRSANADAHQQS